MPPYYLQQQGPTLNPEGLLNQPILSSTLWDFAKFAGVALVGIWLLRQFFGAPRGKNF